MVGNASFENPKPQPKIEDCFFYHSIDLPGYGTLKGSWDLRGHADDYFGKVDLRGKRVLDVGTATGFFAFEAERRGAEVIAFDLGEDVPCDQVPTYHELTVRTFGASRAFIAKQDRVMRMKMRNGFWFCHHALRSSVKVCYGNAYDIPQKIGDVDIAFFGAILLHMRDPLTAVESASRLAREAVIITEPMFHPTNDDLPTMMFLPSIRQPRNLDTFWQHTPVLMGNFLEILGFTETKVNYHDQIYNDLGGTEIKFFTVVGRRPSQCNFEDDLGLKYVLDIPLAEYQTKMNGPIDIEMTISNVGRAKWLHKGVQESGVVKLGMHLYDANMKIINLDFFRSTFDEDVSPGQKIMKRVSVTLPNKGVYYLEVDLVSEHICWFENMGNRPVLLKVVVE
jgi:hypothetical protein